MSTPTEIVYPFTSTLNTVIEPLRPRSIPLPETLGGPSTTSYPSKTCYSLTPVCPSATVVDPPTDEKHDGAFCKQYTERLLVSDRLPSPLSRDTGRDYYRHSYWEEVGPKIRGLTLDSPNLDFKTREKPDLRDRYQDSRSLGLRLGC